MPPIFLLERKSGYLLWNPHNFAKKYLTKPTRIVIMMVWRTFARL